MGKEVVQKAEEHKTRTFTFIEDKKGLDRLVSEISGCRVLAVDLEADSMYHFKERVCLIQIKVNGKSYVVDPLAVEDLSPLKPVFADPGVEKILHGADYDIRCLYRDFRIRVKNLFDTQVAARFIGIRETGLASLLQARFGVTLEKKYQKSNWAKRPLPPDMLAYAVEDTAHLAELAAALKEELTALGRLDWVLEECEILSRVRPVQDDKDTPLFLRFKGAGKLDRRSLMVLENVLLFRKRTAKRLDRPPFKVMGSAPIMEVVQKKPSAMEELSRCRTITPKQARMFGANLVKRVRQALEIPENELPAYPRKPRERVSPRASARINALKDWRLAKAEALALEPSVLITNHQIREISLRKRKKVQDLEKIQDLRNWQRAALGEEIMEVLATVP